MRARHRHFNPRDAGATAAFDARYGISVSSGSGVDTWVNRSGSNDATQGAPSAQPIYRATGGPNGLEAVEFDGNDDHLIHFVSLTVAPNLMMAVAARTGGAGFSTIVGFCPPNTANFNIMYSSGYGAGSANWGVVPTDSGQSILNSWKILSAKPLSTATSNSSTTVWTDGSNEVTSTGSRYGGDVTNRRYIGEILPIQAPLVGSVSLVTAIPKDVESPLRRRLEHAASYSFKIPCA